MFIIVREISVNRKPQIKKLTNQEIINKFIKIHKNRYDYSKVNYQSDSKKVAIRCRTHGDFYQIPNAHKRGQGCPLCADEKTSERCRSNTKEFIEKAKKIHGDKYGYKLVKYTTASKKVKIFCNSHEKYFNIVANKHISGRGCPLCGRKNMGESLTKSTKQFIIDAKEVHGNTYDYSKSSYSRAHEKVTIICDKHGEFLQTASGHTYGKGCNKCGITTRIKNSIMEKEEFIARCKIAHNGIYDYRDTVYLGIKEKVSVNCKKHGVFTLSADSHVRGTGCKKCSNCGTSRAEQELALFVSGHMEIETSNRSLIKNEKTKRPFELDIIIPSKMIAIEYNGTYWHREKFVGKGYHENKVKLCKEEGYDLFFVWEDDYHDRRELVETMILHKLGIIDFLTAKESKFISQNQKRYKP